MQQKKYLRRFRIFLMAFLSLNLGFFGYLLGNFDQLNPFNVVISVQTSIITLHFISDSSAMNIWSRPWTIFLQIFFFSLLGSCIYFCRRLFLYPFRIKGNPPAKLASAGLTFVDFSSNFRSVSTFRFIIRIIFSFTLGWTLAQAKRPLS